MNSKLIQSNCGGGLGDSGYRYKKAFLDQLPVPAPFPIPQGEDFNQALMQKLELSEEEIKFLEKH